jgi:hypothetical protein
MDPTDQTDPTKTSNPDNLPVIEENSLHRIVTTVKNNRKCRRFKNRLMILWRGFTIL